MIQKIHIDLSSIKNKQDLFDVFASTFSFPQYFGNNWDALYDMTSSLDPAATIFQDMKKTLTGIHIILDGFDIFESVFPETDLDRFRTLMVDLSVSRDFRPDHLAFTFEIRYSQI